MKARRYVDICGDLLNLTAFLFPSTSVSEATSMLLKQVRCLSATKVIVNSAFSAGSSKQGKALRASVGSICVVAKIPSDPSAFLYVDL